MQYPYFVYPAVSELKRATDPERIAELKKFIAANVGDPDALVALIGPLDTDLRDFYPDSRSATPTTDDTIDSFIEKFGKNSDPKDLTSLLPDEAAPSDYFESIRQEKTSAPMPPPLAADPMEKVKTLVKNRKYEEALSIMEAIYLNNPKKSVYFADQIRFVRKLMVNDRKKS